jgi:hypothetical protein
MVVVLGWDRQTLIHFPTSTSCSTALSTIKRNRDMEGGEEHEMENSESRKKNPESVIP